MATKTENPPAHSQSRGTPLSSSAGEKWFALYVKPRHEKAVAIRLRGMGYTEFLPLCSKTGARSRRELPFFPSYVFCRFDPKDRLPILTVPGVFSIVGHGKTPVPVEDEEIRAIRAVKASGRDAQAWQYVEAGQKVRIQDGPLAGLDGILLRANGGARMIVSVSLLRRSIAVDVSRFSINPSNASEA